MAERAERQETAMETVLYIHGQGGNAEEAMHYVPLFPGCKVIGMEYQAMTPWEAAEEFPKCLDALCRPCESVTLIANSIGAFFAMYALQDSRIREAYFISPVVDMEKLILDMMGWAKVSEEALREEGTIETDFGQTLSWEYLCYVRAHPIDWSTPTHILYGSLDNLTSRETITAFVQAAGASLTVMDGGEHWFHTQEQLQFLDSWIEQGRKTECRR